VEWSGGLNRSAIIPIEWSGAKALDRFVDLPISWSGVLPRDGILPAEWTAALVRNALIPAEWTLRYTRDIVLPFEVLGGQAFAAIIPMEWSGSAPTPLARTFKIPYEYAGIDPDVLPLSWNVRVLLGQPLLLQWFVRVFPDTFLLPLTWTVREVPASLSIRWGAGPSIFTLFGITPQNSGNPGQAL
jgi:hypothetical protein